MRLAILILSSGALISGLAFGLESKITPFDADEDDAIVLKNDSMPESGGQAFLQLGFVKGEKAGVWLKVPDTVTAFKIDSFRILIGNADDARDSESLDSTQIFFEMGIAEQPSQSIPRDIENAAQVTEGPYWNDIPAQGERGQLRCAKPGEYIGAALEFAHTGSPSVYRDLDNINPKLNTLYAIPGGWNYSIAYGLRGDWVLRVVGHEAAEGECI